MSRRGAGYGVALRIARRDALRAKGRTVLVLCMIGLPVMAIVALSVLFKTGEWSARESLPYDLGRADARLTGVARSPVEQDPTETSFGGGADEAPKPWTTEEITRQVQAKYGPGSKALLYVGGKTLAIRTERGVLQAEATEVDLRDPLTTGLFRVTEGRLPATAGEVALPAEFGERGFRIGASAKIEGTGAQKRVVGFVQDPLSPGRSLAVALPGALPARAGTDGAGTADLNTQWLISTGGKPVTWADVRAFNQLGITVLSRAVVTNPPPDDQIPSQAQQGAGADNATTAVAAMIVAMVVLEVVLLAGPAFAVGVRRQRRQLALVAASGGDARHLRTVVLAGGIVIGGAAALLGAAAGIGLAAVAGPVYEAYSGNPMGPFEIPWALVPLPMVLGALSGLAAAYMPARQAARMDVVAALGGRRDQARSRGGWPIAGGALIIGGIVLCLVGVRLWREFGAALGAIAIIIGCVMIGPWVVGVAGRIAGPLPLPMRLAVRDGARNRGRAAPAVAAIMAAVAGITALAIGGASDFAQNRQEYRPQLPMGSTMIRGTAHEGDQNALTERMRQAVARELPGVPAIPLRSLPGQDRICREPGPGKCPYATFGRVYNGPETIVIDNLVGGPREARLLLGRDDPAVSAALTAGKIVLFHVKPPAGGTVPVHVKEYAEDKEKVVRSFGRLPAIAVPEATGVRAMVPPAVATKVGLPFDTSGFGIDRADHRVTKDEQSRLQERLNGIASDLNSPDVYVERGFTESFSQILLFLGLAGTLMVLGGSLIATGLSAADSRPDLATLAAVGARPRTRRLLMMGQAGFIAILGCWLGMLAGLAPGIAVARPLTSQDRAPAEPGSIDTMSHGTIVAIPWELLGAIGIVVPLIAMLAAGLFTRSRLPMVRRGAA
ncbi:FtsX-like permease family protein [Actinomadura rudentiformis]|uniref:ABC transporter permease n=1 Tax=Actinomadura rudentiformis TaxID=359158 RepID=A0A6H9YBM5_9ACTN|nr:ABC transporter permease [Actinomadura rudentiformis]KAB2342415.1 ABC transporter permease [Actinomadura rudentiformis]